MRLHATVVQQQRLSLSPQLVQSIKLMALPLADLRERIYEEAALNPALEILADPSLRPLPESAPASTPSTTEVSDQATAQLDLPDWSERSDGTTWGGDQASDEHQDFIEGVLTRSQTLQEYLMQQLSLCSIEKHVRELAELIIQNLDRDGFHSIPLTELLAPVAPVQPHDRDAALALVRQFDPPGCACTDVHESLIVQAELMRPVGRTDPALEKAIIILRDYFSLLEKGRPDALVRALSRLEGASIQLSVDEADDVFAIIRSLEPFPGRLFDSAPPAWVAPDVFVRRNDECEFILVMNEEEIPVLGVSPFFLELERSPAGGEGRDFAHESLKEARWFIQSLHKRALTILKVARVLLVMQKAFFERGPGHLVPLRLKDVAAETGLHEATISRATRGKYMQCEWGLFEMSRFFSGRVASIPASGGRSGPWEKEGPIPGDLSRDAVKELIRTMITDSKKPLSDQKIADRLAEKGIQVARRTVAKYRSELTISSSFDR